jgi:hypothetical protein
MVGIDTVVVILTYTQSLPYINDAFRLISVLYTVFVFCRWSQPSKLALPAPACALRKFSFRLVGAAGRRKAGTGDLVHSSSQKLSSLFVPQQNVMLFWSTTVPCQSSRVTLVVQAWVKNSFISVQNRLLNHITGFTSHNGLGSDWIPISWDKPRVLSPKQLGLVIFETNWQPAGVMLRFYIS